MLDGSDGKVTNTRSYNLGGGRIMTIPFAYVATDVATFPDLIDLESTW